MLPTMTVIGNVNRMETKQTQSGKTVTSMTVSCGDKNSKGEYDNLYIKASFWEKQSEFISKYFKDGDAIIVTGKIVTTNYVKQDGTKVYETQFLFPSASFLPKSRDAQTAVQPQYQQPQVNTQVQPQQQAQVQPQAVQPQYQQQATPVDVNEENIPF